MTVAWCAVIVACGGASSGDVAKPVQQTANGDAGSTSDTDASATSGTDKVPTGDGSGSATSSDLDAVDPGNATRVATGPSASGNKPPAPRTKKPKAEPRFKTSISRKKMSRFLIEPARAAIKKRQWPRAIALYQGIVVARGPGSPEALELARAWTLAGQYDAAVPVLDRFIEHTDDDKALASARKERNRLANQSNPFARSFQVRGARREAGVVFKKGRKAFRKKKYADAAVYFEMGYALDVDLPGFLRELGATYDRLKAPDKKARFYAAYLRRRPFGKNAKEVRKALGKKTRILGKLTIASAMRCDEVWVNRQKVPGKLPVKNILVAPGDYKALCISYKYQIAYFEYAKVRLTKPGKLTFNWAVVVNALKNPMGRIRLEDARRSGTMMDLGISTPEVGVVVPGDGRALKVSLQALDGSRREERFLRIQPGSREVIKW